MRELLDRHLYTLLSFTSPVFFCALELAAVIYLPFRL